MPYTYGTETWGALLLNPRSREHWHGDRTHTHKNGSRRHVHRDSDGRATVPVMGTARGQARAEGVCRATGHLWGAYDKERCNRCGLLREITGVTE